MLNRPSPRSVDSLERLRAAVPHGKFVPIDCDLQDFASVRRACDEIKKARTELYCLSNNAAIMATPDEITAADGFDRQMQTNHLSHFLLTRELLPLLKASARNTGDARIVQHGSVGRHLCRNGRRLRERYLTRRETDGTLGGDKEKALFMFGPQWERYFQTKLANSVFTQALHDRLSSSEDGDTRRILSLGAHPGFARTRLADHVRQGKLVDAFWKGWYHTVLQSAEDGAMGLLKAMMDTRDNVEGGILYGPRFLSGYPIAMPPRAHESDPKSKAMLWRTSETAIGASFDIV